MVDSMGVMFRAMHYDMKVNWISFPRICNYE